jgi:hypothetical protein
MLNLFTLMPELGLIYNLSKNLLKDNQHHLIPNLKLSKLLVLINLKFSSFLILLLKNLYKFILFFFLSLLFF